MNIPIIETRFDLSDDELFEAAEAAAEEHEEIWGSAWHPQRSQFVTFARLDGRIASLAVWQDWEGEAFIGTAWTVPAFRQQGLYRDIVAVIKIEAAKRGLKCVSACVDGKNAVSLAVHDRLLVGRSIVKFELDLQTE